MHTSPVSSPPDQLEAWLQRSLPSQDRHCGADGLLDVGAYLGSFTAAMLQGGVCRRAWMFEPNPASLVQLRASYANRDSIEIVPMAVGSQVRRRQLKRSGHPSTASLLLEKDDQLPDP